MTDPIDPPVVPPATPDVAELQAKFDAAQKETESMRGKLDELLGETKTAKKKAREAEEAAEAERVDKAKKAGDYEQLHQSSETKRQELETELEQLRDSVANEKRQTAALRLAGEIADGPNADILSDYISKRLKPTDDGLKVIDGSGNLTVSTLAELQAEFKADARYASLLRGNQSSGGSAAPRTATGGSATAKTKAQRIAAINDRLKT